MKYYILFSSFILGIILLSLSSCSSKSEEEKNAVIDLSENKISLSQSGVTQTFRVTSNMAWKISVSHNDWITVTPMQGDPGETEVEVKASMHPDYMTRSLQLTLTVNKSPKKRTLEVSQIGDPGPEGSELAALIALYRNLDGENWSKKSNWLTNKPIGEWEGVRTDENGHVILLYFYANNLFGSIPEEIGNFPYLENLSFIRNNLNGQIPSSIGRLQNLSYLEITQEKVSGDLPESIGELIHLKKLLLNDNRLTGNFPASLGNLKKLTHLTLHNNQLSGSLSECLGQLRELTLLNLSNNQDIKGEIPECFGNLTALQTLSLQHNNLTG